MPMPNHLVLLPGLLCDSAVWEPVIDSLSFSGQITIPDYGTLDNLGAMAEHVLNNINSDTFAVAGHSMGGRIAMEIYRRAPERISHFVLLDTAIHAIAEGEVGKQERDGRMSLLNKAQSEGMREMGRKWATNMVHPHQVDTEVFEDLLDMIARKNPEIFAAQINALLERPDAESVLETVSCPTSIICGQEDRWSPASRHKKMAEIIPQSSLHIIPYCGHMSTMECPEAVGEVLKNLLEN